MFRVSCSKSNLLTFWWAKASSAPNRQMNHDNWSHSSNNGKAAKLP